MRWRVILLALPGLLAPLALSGQAPTARLQLAALRDSVVQLASAAAATAAADAERASLERNQTDALRLTQAGLAQLRVGQLSSDRTPLDRAQALFDEAVYRAPDDWPWPWYGLALADLALDSTDAVVKASMHSGAGVYYHDAALHALGKALEADSSFIPAAALLGDILLPFGERSLSNELKRAVRRAAATNSVALPWLALGRVYRNLHQPDSALWAFRHFVQLGGDAGLGLLEQARSLYDLGQLTAATTAYLHGATIADSLARAHYRRDVAWVATPAELAAFDAAPRDSLGAFVTGFWAKRDAEALRGPGERLAEHVRRWRYVFEHFQLSARAEGTPQRGGANCGTSDFPSLSQDPLRDDPDPRAVERMAPPDFQLFEPGVFAATWRGKRLVDDRALIYMRHGEPDERAAYHGPRAKPWDQREVFPNESWKYRTPHGTLLFHFCGSMALGSQAPTTLVEMLPLASTVLESRGGLDPRFNRLASNMRSHAGSILLQALIRDGWRDIRSGLSTDEFPVNYRNRIEPLAQFFAVGQPASGTSRVLTIFAFDGADLVPSALPQGGVVYPIALRLIATDAEGHFHRVDTTRYFRSADTLQQGQYLYGLETLPLPAGTWDVTLLVTQPDVDAGGAIERRHVSIGAGNSLTLSDLVFGRAGSGLSWQSPHGTVPLSPLDAYPREGAVEVYYELSHAKPGREYTTRIELTDVSGHAKGAVTLSFREQARDPLLHLRRSVALDQLDGGQYRMTVTVTEQGTGRTATRGRLLNVIR